MKRLLMVLLAGAAGGVSAYFGWLGVHRPVQSGDLAAQLAWIQHDLQLTPAQFARIKALHEQSSPRLLALETEVARLRDELTAFERGRRITGQVDFLEFARFVEQRRAVDQACTESTRQLILAASKVMTPEQRTRYLALLEPVRHGPLAQVLN
jgi:hypothetical protein